jgi:ABC-type nickel/cobalt efflux system permease component RcnA
MTAFSSAWQALQFAAVQYGDPSSVSNMGTAVARQGAAQRLAEPNPYDVIFPGIAFVLVILVPTAIGLWVIWRTVRDQTKEQDEH